MSDLFAALDATWPPLSEHPSGPFRLRVGAGGGKRVSAAVLDGAFDLAAFDALGAPPLFQVRQSQDDLDAALAARGYVVVDPTILLAAPVVQIAQEPPPVFLLGCWPPLAIQRNLWAGAGTGPERLAVMDRASAPKQAFIIRHQDRPAGIGFVALHEGTAMLHALHIEPAFRRQGLGARVVRAMAHWATGQGAQTFALAVTRANAPALALYTGLGMIEAGAYHYREKRP